MIYFLVTIDTEEEGLWGNDYKRHDQYTVENIKYLRPFQNFCDNLGLKPTYLIDFPVAYDKIAFEILKSLTKEGNCEVGTHLHPWCNPPYEEEINVRNTFTNNLPQELQYKKLKVLTEIIENNIGIHPVSYRAGRYGFDGKMISILENLEYKVDSSIVPYRIGKEDGEPTFGRTPLNPYPLNYFNILNRGDSKIIEIPISVEYTRRIPIVFKDVYPELPNIGIRRVLRSICGLDLVWLRPSYSSLEDMIRLCRSLIKQNVSVLNMMFHSTELMPEASPYNKTHEDVHRFLEKIRKFVNIIRDDYHIQFVTLSDVGI